MYNIEPNTWNINANYQPNLPSETTDSDITNVDELLFPLNEEEENSMEKGNSLSQQVRKRPIDDTDPMANRQNSKKRKKWNYPDFDNNDFNRKSIAYDDESIAYDDKSIFFTDDEIDLHELCPEDNIPITEIDKMTDTEIDKIINGLQDDQFLATLDEFRAENSFPTQDGEEEINVVLNVDAIPDTTIQTFRFGNVENINLLNRKINELKSDVCKKTKEIEILKKINCQWQNICQEYYNERVAEEKRCNFFESVFCEKTEEIQILNNSNIQLQNELIQLQNELQRKSTDLKAQTEITKLKLKCEELKRKNSSLENYCERLSSMPRYFATKQLLLSLGKQVKA